METIVEYKSFDDLSEDIKKNLYKIHAGNYDLVVGIPRSGMIPAYMIGLYLNIHVMDFNSLLENKPLKKGITRKVKKEISLPQEAQKILLVDDSISTGESMAKIIEEMPDILKSKVTTLAIYSNEVSRDDIDSYLEFVPLPRVFEWNIFHRSLLGQACLDIDGVLCQDPSEEDNDDSSNYISFLLNAKPHIIPTYKVHSLVTSRLEKYRPQTETWLKKHNITYENLIMLDLPDMEARRKLGNHAEHKAKYFRSKSELDIFIESDINQAQKIMELAGKPVYCVDENVMFAPNSLNYVLKNPRKVASTKKARITQYLPNWLKSFLRPIYRTFIKKT